MLTTTLLAALLLSHTPPALRVSGTDLVDAQGRVTVLRGVNASCDAKLPPFQVMEPRDMDPLPRMGMNVVRLLFIWEAFEPKPGAYDANYLAYFTRLVEAAQARKLYVVVDFHQDGMARGLIDGCGEGFPAWAVTPLVKQKTPDNGKRCRAWAVKAALSHDLARAWRAFYANENGARDSYLRMVQKVATELRAYPAVIGYDLLNEPSGDEAHEIAPLYEDAARGLHAVDPDAIIFAAPAFWTSIGRASQMPRPAVQNLVYAPHLYDMWLMSTHVWFGNAQQRAFNHMRQVASAWNTPLFIGEFGAPGDVPRSRPYLRSIYQQLDDGFISGTQWCYTRHWTPERKDGWNSEDLSLLDDHGRPRYVFEARPFAEATAGTPWTFTSDLDRRRFEFTWEHNPSAGATQIVLPDAALAAPRIETRGRGLTCTRGAGRISCASSDIGTMYVAVDY